MKYLLIIFNIFLLFSFGCDSNSKKIRQIADSKVIAEYIDSLHIKWNWCFESKSLDEIKENQQGHFYKVDSCELLSNGCGSHLM